MTAFENTLFKGLLKYLYFLLLYWGKGDWCMCGLE